MDCLVTGIAPTADKAQVEALLAQCQCDPQRLAIVSKSSPPGAAGQHGGHSNFSSAATIMTGSSGTSVPGIGGSGASLSSFGGQGGVTDYLGGLPLIPSDQAHNYNVAIAEGRSLVTYKANDAEAASIEAAFREAGLRKVKTFRSKETSLG